MGALELSLFGSNCRLNIASKTVNRLVNVSSTHEETLSRPIPEAGSRSSCILLLPRHWLAMHRFPARTDLGYTQMHRYSQWPLESLRALKLIPPATQ